MKKIILAVTIALGLSSCAKNGENVPQAPPVVISVPERLEISPTSTSVIIGNNAQFTAKYFNTQGVESPLPSGALWSSLNPAIASVNQQGLATGLANGNTNIRITYNAAIASAPFTVVANPNQLASVNVTPNTAQEILINQTIQFAANGANIAGGAINGLTFTWASSNNSVATINQAGLLTSTGYGSTNISSTAMGVQSGAVSIDVVRKGNFVTGGSGGSAKLQLENNILKLKTGSNFFIGNHPDLRMYLGNNASNINGAVQIASLSTAGQTNGAFTWNVPSGVSITQFRYAIVWCAQFGGIYGVADFGL